MRNAKRRRLDLGVYLPMPILCEIMSFCDLETWSCARLVCGEWNFAATNRVFMQTVARETYKVGWTNGNPMCAMFLDSDDSRLAHIKGMLNLAANLHSVAREELQKLVAEHVTEFIVEHGAAKAVYGGIRNASAKLIEPSPWLCIKYKTGMSLTVTLHDVKRDLNDPPDYPILEYDASKTTYEYETYYRPDCLSRVPLYVESKPQLLALALWMFKKKYPRIGSYV